MTTPCRGRTDLFFSEYSDDMALAIALCEICEVRAGCLETATRNREPCGVWGGRLFVKGRPSKSINTQGRPQRRPSANTRWTPSLDRELAFLRRCGMTWGQISAALLISPGACQYRHRQLTAATADGQTA